MPTKVNPAVEPTAKNSALNKKFAQKGAAALLAKYGPDHFSKISKLRWDRVRKAKRAAERELKKAEAARIEKRAARAIAKA